MYSSSWHKVSLILFIFLFVEYVLYILYLYFPPQKKYLIQFFMCDVARLMCHVKYVTCCVSPVICHLSLVTCHLRQQPQPHTLSCSPTPHYALPHSTSPPHSPTPTPPLCTVARFAKTKKDQKNIQNTKFVKKI